MNSHFSRLGVMCALQGEQHMLLQHLSAPKPLQLHGQRSYHRGRLWGVDAVMVLSGVGKVAAACTATSLIAEFGCDAVVFTGTAGGLGPGVAVGDIVIAQSLLQHDLDASPLFPRFEVPLTGRSRFDADPAWSQRLADGAQAALQGLLSDLAGHARLQALGIEAPRVHRGLLISGDRFVCGAGQAAALLEALPDALAVDMESAAVAQVCTDYRVPFAAVRSISDRADLSAHIDFDRFLNHVARHYSAAVLGAALRAA